MKSLTTLLVLLLCTNLLARENPFVPTNAYKEEVARMIEINGLDPDYEVELHQERQYVNKIYKQINKTGVESEEKNVRSEPVVTKNEVKKMIKEAQKKSEPKIIIKEIIKEPEQQIVYVKPRLDVTLQKKLLPFVKIEFDDDRIDIFSKYKVSKKITLPGKKKIVLDYMAKENFYTVRKTLESSNFPKIIVGNHKKENFFRVVVELAHMPENYDITYNDKKVSIIKLYE